MPQPLRKTYPALDLDRAQEQVRKALKRAVEATGEDGKRLSSSVTDFVGRLNLKLVERGHRPISRQAVMWWMSEGTFVDRIYWEPIEQISDMATTRRQLRPDVYRDG
jgi:hypothetical protein